MLVEYETELLAALPDRFVHRVESGRSPLPGAMSGSSTPPARPALAIVVDLGQRVVEVVEQDLADAGVPARNLRAEVGEPAVVGAEAGHPQFVLGRRRQRREQVAAREERRHGVGEQHLGGDAVGLELALAALAVPAAIRVRHHLVEVRIDERLRPGVELVEAARLEVRPVVGQIGTAVPVGADDRVAIGSGRGRRSHL